ncbi:MAG: DUF4954 family protein [Rikenellaceae bacterium]|nr:DUF4954 family protein [Rikenellaceae bacterium]
MNYRSLTPQEIERLIERGNYATDWSKIEVAPTFRCEQLTHSRLLGRVRVGDEASIFNSTVENYAIGARSRIESITRLECRRRSSFGNGVMVATMNECEGRQVKIYDRMSAQIAYMLAIYRHRPALIARLEAMIDRYAEERSNDMGEVGEDCHLNGARFIREMRIGNRVTVDGSTTLENGTLCDDVRVGVDVKAYDFIMAEGARVANGVMIERCFVGESVIMDKGFSAMESLFFANSHCENGEAAAIFAGPYTVSHHKSSLLIAGMFSFFNAGSGTNQSNHLFKSGAVHQSVHPRGCKFASSAYVMSPALEGAFTVILGKHSHHHDTSSFPYSYLIEKEGRSTLMPGANLKSYGLVRDIEKWPKRDKRRLKRDCINFEEYNPYIGQSLIAALTTLNRLREEEPEAELFNYKRVFIQRAILMRGVKLYQKAIVASLGDLLTRGKLNAACDGRGRWLDMAGQYIAKSYVEQLIAEIEQGEITSTEQIDERFRQFLAHYDDYAHHWALCAYEELRGRLPGEREVEDLITAGRNAHAALRELTDEDRRKDCSMEMAVSYGLDSDSEEELRADYYNVRGLN